MYHGAGARVEGNPVYINPFASWCLVLGECVAGHTEKCTKVFVRVLLLVLYIPHFDQVL